MKPPRRAASPDEQKFDVSDYLLCGFLDLKGIRRARLDFAVSLLTLMVFIRELLELIEEAGRSWPHPALYEPGSPISRI